MLQLQLPHTTGKTTEVIKFENREITHKMKIAEAFNNYFVRSIENIVTNSEFQEDKQHVLPYIQKSFTNFQLVIMDELKKIIRKLKNAEGTSKDIATPILREAMVGTARTKIG